MKLFRTGSSSTVNECQVNFGFLPVKIRYLFVLLDFLQKFITLENSLCTLFANYARRQLLYLNFVSSENDIKQNNRNNGIADDTGNRRELVHLHGTYT